MIHPSIKAEIRYLHAHKGLSMRAIAKKLHLSRTTVRQVIQGRPPRVRQRPSRPSKLDPYKKEVQRLLKEYPRISGIRIFEDLCAQGYTGKTTILNDYIKTLRTQNREAFFRLQFAPGRQAQVDWGSCGRIDVEGYSRRLSVFAMVLSCSRMLYAEFTISERIEEFLRCHVNAFSFFSGVPETVLYDNLKSVVYQRSGPVVQFNRRFLDFAAHYCIQPRVCGVAKGNEKGRVESAIKYIKGNFLAGRNFTTLCDINDQVRRWLDMVANVRVHGSTHRRPVDLFKDEQPLLGRLPEARYDTAVTVPVRVSKDCFVQFQTNSYSVPIRYVSQKLTLKATAEKVYVYKDTDRVAVHERCWAKYRSIEDPDHFAGLLFTKHNAYANKARQRFILLGEGAPLYLEGLAQAAVNARVHVDRILKLADLYGKAAVVKAIAKALEHDAYGAEYIENIILRRRAQDKCTEPVNTLLFEDETGFGDVTVPEPDLARYDEVAGNESDTSEQGDDHGNE